MTTDQWLILLSFLVWPLTALIAGSAFVRGVRLLNDGLSDLPVRLAAVLTRHREISQHETTYTIMRPLPGILRSAMLEFNRPNRPSVDRTAELGLLAMLQARGGLPVPAPNGDPAVRQLVREVRKMYDELEHPTPEPDGGYVNPDDDMDPDERMLQELFGGGGVAEDEAEPVELPEEDL